MFERVEFIPLSASACWSSSSRAAARSSRRSSTSSEPLGADELRQAANYLNAEFAGLPLAARARGGARADRRGADALRRAAGARDAAGVVDVRGSARTRHALRGRRRVAARRRRTGSRSARCRRCSQMIEEKQRLVRLLNEYIDGPGLTVVIGAEHPDPNLRSFSLVASTYDDGGHRHGRRHRADAHALLARHRRRRRRRAGRVARAARSELGTRHELTNTSPRPGRTRHRPAATDRIRRTGAGRCRPVADAPAASATTTTTAAAQDGRVRQLPQARSSASAASRPIRRSSICCRSCCSSSTISIAR